MRDGYYKGYVKNLWWIGAGEKNRVEKGWGKW